MAAGPTRRGGGYPPVVAMGCSVLMPAFICPIICSIALCTSAVTGLPSMNFHLPSCKHRVHYQAKRRQYLQRCGQKARQAATGHPPSPACSSCPHLPQSLPCTSPSQAQPAAGIEERVAGRSRGGLFETSVEMQGCMGSATGRGDWRRWASITAQHSTACTAQHSQPSTWAPPWHIREPSLTAPLPSLPPA